MKRARVGRATRSALAAVATGIVASLGAFVGCGGSSSGNGTGGTGSCQEQETAHCTDGGFGGGNDGSTQPDQDGSLTMTGDDGTDASMSTDGASGEGDDGGAGAGDSGGGGTDAGPDGGTFTPPPYAVAGTVNAILHAGRSWYIGGLFDRVSTYPAANLVPVDGSGKPAACPVASGFDGAVLTLVQMGTSVFAGGSFTHYQGQAASGIAKIDATTCALDQTFGPTASTAFSGGSVFALAVSGSSVYVGGSFTTYRSAALSHLAKLDATTGAADTTFSPTGAAANGVDGDVNTLAVSGTSLYLGGSFAKYRNAANSARNLAKVDLTSGAIDAAFSPVGAATNGFNGAVNAFALSGNSLYVGGAFTAYKSTAASANHLAKLDLASGVIDTTFSPVGAMANGTNSAVLALAVSGTALYAGGTFTAYKGVANSANLVAKVDLTTGAIDTTFSPVGATSNGFNASASPISSVVTSLVAAGTALYVGGSTFTSYRGAPSSALNFAKLDLTTGAQDTTFHPPSSNANGVAGPSTAGVTSIEALMAMGTTLWIGGNFSVYGGTLAHNIAKLDDATFAADTTFSPFASNGFDNLVGALATSGTSLYVGGHFTMYKGVAASATHVAKLDLTSGTIDSTFSAGGFNNDVFALAVNATSVYAGGAFTTYRANGASSALSIAKLDATSGAQDTAFGAPGVPNNGFNGQVAALALSGTSLYVGGAFAKYKSVANSALGLAKLDQMSGAIDTTFSPAGPTNNGFDSSVSALAATANALYVGGAFTKYKNIANTANGLAKLDLTTGALDTTFSPPGAAANGVSGTIFTLTSASGALYLGGTFTAYRGSAATNLAKVDATSGALDTVFSPSGAPSGTNATVVALGVGNGALLAGGYFQSYRTTFDAPGVVVLDPTTGVYE